MGPVKADSGLETPELDFGVRRDLHDATRSNTSDREMKACLVRWTVAPTWSGERGEVHSLWKEQREQNRDY